MEMRSVWNYHLLQVGSVPDCVGVCVFFYILFLDAKILVLDFVVVVHSI